MEPATAFAQAFEDIQKDLRGYLHVVDPSKPTADLVIRFAQIQAKLGDDLRASLDLPPFDRERVVMTTLKAFRDALMTAGLVDESMSMRLAKEAVAKVGLRVQAQSHDAEFADQRQQAMHQLTADSVTMWVWKATLDVRTCLYCISQNGRSFPVGIPLESHPNCRCRPVPEGSRIASGDVFLRNLSRANRRRVMGEQRARMWESGDYALTDLVDADRRTAVPLRQFKDKFAAPTPGPAMTRMDKSFVQHLVHEALAETPMQGIQAEKESAIRQLAGTKRPSMYDVNRIEQALFWGGGQFGEVGPYKYPKQWVRVKTSAKLPPNWEVDMSHTQMAHKVKVRHGVEALIPDVFHYIAKLGLKSNWNGLVEIGKPDVTFGDPAPYGLKGWQSGIWLDEQPFHDIEFPSVYSPEGIARISARRRVIQTQLLVHEMTHSFSNHDSNEQAAYTRYSWLEEGPAELLSRIWASDLIDPDDIPAYDRWLESEEVRHHSYTFAVKQLDTLADAIDYHHGPEDGPLPTPGAQLCFEMMKQPISHRATWLKKKVEAYRTAHHGHFKGQPKYAVDSALRFLTRDRSGEADIAAMGAEKMRALPKGRRFQWDTSLEDNGNWANVQLMVPMAHTKGTVGIRWGKLELVDEYGDQSAFMIDMVYVARSHRHTGVAERLALEFHRKYPKATLLHGNYLGKAGKEWADYMIAKYPEWNDYHPDFGHEYAS